MSQLTFLLGEPHANHSQLLDLGKGLDDPRGNLMLTYLSIAAKLSPKLARLGKCPWRPIQLTEDSTLPASFGGWANSAMGSHTEFLTLSTSEWPSAAAVCSLSDTLESWQTCRSGSI
jgi:hypothetical protein